MTSFRDLYLMSILERNNRFGKYCVDFLEKFNKKMKENIVFNELTYERLLSIIMKDTIMCCYMHPVKLCMVFEEINFDILYHYLLRGVSGDIDFVDELMENIHELNWEEQIMIQKKLTGYTTFNGNDDDRGGGCGNLGVPISEFEYTIHNDKGITLRDLTEIVYRLKGSKYDWWYELYTGFKCKQISDEECIIEINFNYGS